MFENDNINFWYCHEIRNVLKVLKIYFVEYNCL